MLKQDGQWRGAPQENEVDYTFTQVAIPQLTLEPDHSYTLKVYANDDELEKIYGIVRLVARLYAREESTEED